jgi:hypothetical protein
MGKGKVAIKTKDGDLSKQRIAAGKGYKKTTYL